MKKHLDIFLLFFIFVIGLIFRLYHLDQIPGEMWGDIVEGYTFTQLIITGKWPFYFVLGNGPLFFYIVSAFSLIIGLSFMTMKITSVIVGMVLVFGTYLLGNEIRNRWLGLLAAFFMAISRWPVTFSRWGNMNILVAVFIVFIFYFLTKAFKYNRKTDFIMVGVLTGIGLFNYPAFLFVPVTLGLILLYCLFFKRDFVVKNKYRILLAVGVFIPFALYFYTFISSFGFMDGSSYFGSKFFAHDGTIPPDFFIKLLETTGKSFGMFHIRGDEGFRANIAEKPHLDVISGMLLLVGLAAVFMKKEFRKWAFLLFIPFVMLQLPAILVINVPSDVPNITRSIGILPFLYTIIAIGTYSLFSIVRRFKIFSLGLVIAILLGIAVLNWHDYFVSYAHGLPNNNTPFGKIISQLIDQLPPDKSIVMVGCCWGEWGQPDSRAVEDMSSHHHAIHFIDNYVCIPELPDKNSFFVVNPEPSGSLLEILACYPSGVVENIKNNGYGVATTINIP